MNSKTVLKPQLPIILNQIKDYLQSLYQEDLEDVILFGSQARGEAEKDSDIDILIVLKTPFNYCHEVRKISQFISDLCLENNLLITCCFTTAEKWQQENSAFYRNIRKEGIKLDNRLKIC